MSDLISREDAIKAVTIAVLADKDEIEALKAIPSVQVNGDLISRQDAIEAVCGVVIDAFDVSPTKGYEVSEKALSALPTAEPSLKAIKRQIDEHWYLDPPSAEAVQGEWIDIDNYYRMATCSHCHKVTMFEKWGEYTKPYDFCPNCGAKMHKGGEDECL